MATVKKKLTRKMYVDPSPAVRALARLTVDHMQRRIRAGIDRDGKPFAPWSELYRMSREAAGYGGGTPGVLTGGTVNSITLKGRSGSSALNTVLRFGPEMSSQAPPRPAPWVFSEKKTPLQRATAVADWQDAKKRKPRSIQRTRLVWMLGHIQRAGAGGRRKRVRLPGGGFTTVITPATKGTVRSKVRKMLGITPAARAQIIHEIERAKIFR